MRLREMPPKPKKEVEEPPPEVHPYRLTAKDLRAGWLDSLQGEVECRQIVDKVVEAMEQEIVRAHMDHTAVPWTTQSVLTDLMESILLQFTDRETKVITEEESADLCLHVKEPMTIPPDSWARASILQRRLLVRPDSEFGDRVKAKERTGRERALTTTAASSKSNLPMGKHGPAVVSDTASTSSPATGSGPSRHRRLSIQQMAQATRRRPVDADADAANGGDRENPIETGREAMEEAAKTEAEMQMLEAQRLQREHQTFLRNVAAKINKQVAEVTRSNPNAQFSIDGASLTVLPVVQPDPRKLAAAVSEPKVVISEEGEVREVQSPKGRRGFSPFGTVPKRKPAKQTAGASAPTNFWKPEAQASPMITGITPAAGVASKEGDSYKRADPRTHKSRMTRSDFNKMIQLQNQMQLMPQLQPLDAEEDARGGTGKPPLALKETPPVEPVMASKVIEAPRIVPQQRSASAQYKSQAIAPIPALRASTPILRPRKGDFHFTTVGGVHPRPESAWNTERPSSYGSRAVTPMADSRPASHMAHSRPPSRVVLNAHADDDTAREFLASMSAAEGNQRDSPSFGVDDPDGD